MDDRRYGRMNDKMEFYNHIPHLKCSALARLRSLKDENGVKGDITRRRGVVPAGPWPTVRLGVVAVSERTSRSALDSATVQVRRGVGVRGDGLSVISGVAAAPCAALAAHGLLSAQPG